MIVAVAAATVPWIVALYYSMRADVLLYFVLAILFHTHLDFQYWKWDSEPVQ